MTMTELEFSTSCIGNVADELHISQSEVYRMLKDSGILSDYIVKYYDVLHTYGRKYMTNELISLLKERKMLPIVN